MVFKGAIRLHDLLEASDDEYGFVRTEIERALDCRDATEEEIMRESPARMSQKVRLCKLYKNETRGSRICIHKHDDSESAIKRSGASKFSPIFGRKYFFYRGFELWNSEHSSCATCATC